MDRRGKVLSRRPGFVYGSATDDGYFDDNSDGVLDEYVYNYTLGGLLEFVHNKDGLGSAPVTISMPEAADNIPPQ